MMHVPPPPANMPIVIGNFLTSAPSGIAFLDQNKSAFVVDTGAKYFAGEAAPDDSYHEVRFAKEDANVRFEWGRRGDMAIARIRSDRAVTVSLNFIQSWPDIKTEYALSANEAIGTSAGITWHLQLSRPASRQVDSTLEESVRPESPLYFVAGIGRLPGFHGIDQSLDASRTKYLDRKPRASGDWGDFLGAIADNLNNSRIYSTDNQLLAHTVSRGWASTPNSAPYFCWDSFFNGNLASLDDPKTARETVKAILSCQTPEGLVPNFGHWNFAGGRSSDDRSQPPVGSMCVWKMHQRWPDTAFLKEVYPRLAEWHAWWPKGRDGNHDGLLEWGSATGQLQGAKWETGWDDTVHFEGAKMVGPNMDADAVDLNSMWAMDAEYLARIADAIGQKLDAEGYRREYTATRKRIDQELWNPAQGIYCSKLWDGSFLTRLTPMNFYPLLAGIPDTERAEQVLSVMQDPKRFWGEWILPTVAYDDPVWPQQDYWKGKVWAPVNYLVFQGLLRYASPETINHFADRSLRLFMSNWESKGVCGENYLSKDGTQSSDPHYTWGSLLCLVGLESIVHTLPDGRIWLNGTIDAHAQLDNIPLGGRLYRVVVTPRHTELQAKHGGRILVASDKIAVGSL
jgi:hypothetical protein